MKYINLIQLQPLMNRTSGSSGIKIGLIDGPVLLNHPFLDSSNIIEVAGSISGSCSNADSIACGHGTFIAGLLKAKRDSVVPGICPDSTLLVRPVFYEHALSNDIIPSSNSNEIATAIIDCINSGAQIINLSLAIATPSIKIEKELENALNYAAGKGIIVVASAGNQGMIGSTAITRHPWVIPVIACNQKGNPLQMSNFSNSIGRNGLSAPGENIKSLGTKNNIVTLTGTSVATPFVTGVIALLWGLNPSLTGFSIKQAVTCINNRRSVIPPLINAQAAYDYLNINYAQKAVA